MGRCECMDILLLIFILLFILFLILIFLLILLFFQDLAWPLSRMAARQTKIQGPPARCPHLPPCPPSS